MLTQHSGISNAYFVLSLHRNASSGEFSVVVVDDLDWLLVSAQSAWNEKIGETIGASAINFVIIRYHST